MATKKPIKAAKPAVKSIPAKKAAPAKKASSVTTTVKEVAKKVISAVSSKLASKTKTPTKTPVPVKKVVPPVESKKETPAKVVAPKAAAKPMAKYVPPKKALPVRESAVKYPLPTSNRSDASTLTGNKQVIVPSKPAINPRPTKSLPVKEVPRSNKPVSIPKTSTDKKVDYEPEFTKSVLDSPIQQTNNPTMRYSDTELQEFRELINRKLEAAKKELAYLQGLITRKDEMGGDDTDNRYMTMEDGSMSMEREQLSQMASRQITFIDHLEKAIMRIENKTYGICRVTGKLIDKARLRAVPHATLSMEAKLGIVK